MTHTSDARSRDAAASNAGSLESSSVPGGSGLPLIGHTYGFLRNTQALVDRLRAEHGANFRMQALGRPFLVIGHPDAVREVLLDRERVFSSQRGWHESVGELFARGLMLKDYDAHRSDRRLIQMAFRNDAMRGYVDMMNAVTPGAIAAWPRELELYPALKRLTLDMAARIFLGLTLGPDTQLINEAFVAAVAASIALVRREVPLLAFGRGMRGRRKLEQFFATLIQQRRADPGIDLLSELCRAKSDEGDRFTDQAISDHMIFLMMAAHDTTTSSMSMLVSQLLAHPEWQERVRDEIRARGGAPMRWEERTALPALDRCFDETLRMFPPVPFIARRTLRECTLAGFHIPADSRVVPCSLVTHRLPDYWSHPDRFDPDRFASGRAEHTAHSHLYYPFGGGAHVCIGLHFARIQVKVVMRELLGRYRLRDARRAPGARALSAVPIPYPRDGLPVVLEPL